MLPSNTGILLPSPNVIIGRSASINIPNNRKRPKAIAYGDLNNDLMFLWFFMGFLDKFLKAAGSIAQSVADAINAGIINSVINVQIIALRSIF